MNDLQPILATLLVLLLLWAILHEYTIRASIKKNMSPITLAMATHHEHAKFRIIESDELYKAGLRNGMYGAVLRNRTGLYAKTTIDGRCKFMPINSYQWIAS